MKISLTEKGADQYCDLARTLWLLDLADVPDVDLIDDIWTEAAY